jgi:hypothetical protein
MARIFQEPADRGVPRIFDTPAAAAPLTWDEIPGDWDDIPGNFDDAGEAEE